MPAATIKSVGEPREWTSPDGAECWPWVGYRRPDGYGYVFLGHGKRMLAHRYAYMQATGEELTPDRCVCHHCDNPSCVNPAHLFVGSNADNLRDMHRKGRSWVQTHPAEVRKRLLRAKLTEDQVRDIRHRYAEQPELHRVIAARYGVTRAAISHLLRGLTWGDLP